MSNKKSKKKTCMFCGNTFFTDDGRKKCCSSKCSLFLLGVRRLKNKMSHKKYARYKIDKDKKIEKEKIKSSQFKKNRKKLIEKIGYQVTYLSLKDLNKKSGVYIILNEVSNKFYIGSSNDLKKRKIFHFTQLRNNNHFNHHLQNAWNKYGEFNFKFYLLEECAENILEKREEFYIKKFKSSDRKIGYNKTDKCTTSPMKGLKGELNPLFGKKRPKEVMEPMWAASRGDKHCNAKTVIQLDLDGNKIKEFGCISDAARYIMNDALASNKNKCSSRDLKTYRSNISKCCISDKYKKYAGFQWYYK